MSIINKLHPQMDFDKHVLDFENNKIEVDHILASKGKRLANYLLDQLILHIGTMALAVLFELGVYDELDETFAATLILLVYPAYYMVFESLFGRTPAKFITRTVVVTTSGHRPNTINIIGRSLCRYIPFEAFSFLGEKAIGWHDSISKTRVVEWDLWEEPKDEFV